MTLSFRSVFAPALAVAMTLAAVGCSSNKASNTNAATTPANDPVVATYAGKSITQSQLDKKIADQLYEARRQGLEQMIIEDLVQTEAKKEGKTEEEYLKEQIEKKVPPPPEAQLQQFYDQLKDRGYVIYPGKLTVAESFRIGCIGRLYPKDMQGALDAVRAVLDEMRVSNGGPALAAE